LITCGLAIGTDFSQADVSGDRHELRAFADLLGRLGPGEDVELACPARPPATWPYQLPILAVAVTGAQDVLVSVGQDRLRFELGAAGAVYLASPFDSVAADIAAGSGSHAHVEHLDGVTDGIVAGSLPLIVPSCQEAIVTLLEGVLDPAAPAWGVDYDLETLLPILEAGPDQGLYRAVERLLERWTGPT
jgi:hypothetical protein